MLTNVSKVAAVSKNTYKAAPTWVPSHIQSRSRIKNVRSVWDLTSILTFIRWQDSDVAFCWVSGSTSSGMCNTAGSVLTCNVASCIAEMLIYRIYDTAYCATDMLVCSVHTTIMIQATISISKYIIATTYDNHIQVFPFVTLCAQYMCKSQTSTSTP